MSKIKGTIAILASIAAGFAAGYLVNEYTGFAPLPDVSEQFAAMTVDSETLPIAGSPIRGGVHPDAVIVAFVDYATPTFEAFHKNVAEALFKKYGDRIAIVYKNYPLAQNAGSMIRAQASMAALLQNRYWPMADELLKAGSGPFDRNQALDAARNIGLNIEQFTKDLDSPQVRAMIQKDLKQATANDVHQTPAIFVNGHRVTFSGMKVDEKEIATMIEVEIKRLEKLRSDPAFYYFAASHATPTKSNVEYDEPVPTVAEEKPSLRTFVDINGTPTLGNPEAPVVIVEFADFECPVSAANARLLRDLSKKYPDKLRIVFKHRPMAMHPHAQMAHQAAEAASLMGKFWEMHDLLFAHQNALEIADLKQYAAQLGLDPTAFESVLASNNVSLRIQADLKQGASVKVSGAPGYFINGRYVSGVLSPEKFERMISDEMALADNYLKKGANPGSLYKDLIAAENAKIQPNEPKQEERTAPIHLYQGNSIARGPQNAPVVIYQFSDFQCPFSARVEPTMDEILKIYGDKVRIVFKNNPLPFHKDAKLAAEAILAAADQGKFVEMRNSMFKFQNNLTRPALEEFAKWAELDLVKFNQALDNHQFTEQVAREIDEAKRAGIAGTPAFVINGKLIVGAKSVDEFKEIIDNALAPKKNRQTLI